MKKILYVTTIATTINAFLVPHIKHLIKKGYKVDIATNIDVHINQELLDLGVNVFQIPFQRNPLSKINKKAYEEIKKLQKEEKYDIVIYGYYMEFIDENKKISVSPHSREYYSLKSYLEEYSYYRKNGTFGFVWNKLYKSEIIKKNNILFGEYVFPEDVYFNFKILPVCKNIKVIDNILYHYMHQRSDTLSKVSRDKLYTSNRLYDETVKFLKEMNSYDINAQFVNSVYIESLIDYIVSDVVKCNGRVNKLKLLYNEENVRYAINKSQHSLVFYKIMNKMIKFKLPTTSIIFICLYKYYDKIKKLKRG